MQYRRLSILFVLAAAPLVDLATSLAPLWDDMRVKHAWNAVPTNWESLGHPPADTTIDLHIALKPHRENALVDALYEVSDPGLPSYGAHLSKEQAAELVAPHPDTLGLVYSWLEHGGVTSSISITHGGGWLTATGVPVSQANDLLGASYQLYRHTGTNNTIIRTVSYALPAALHAHVQTVAPTTYFFSLHKLQRDREEAGAKEWATSRELVTVLSGRDKANAVWPEFLHWLYNTGTYVPVAADWNALGVAGYQDQSPSQEDLMTFMNKFFTGADEVTFTVVQVNGGKYDPSSPGHEASLNIQYAEGMAYPTPLIYYNIGGKPACSPSSKEPVSGDCDLEWLNYVLSQPYIPQTISISYGNYEKNIPPEYAMTLCKMFAMLGARGVSVLMASGDDGVGKGDCDDGSGNVQFVPVFPASCPWITSVGGTTSHEPEVAASLSGGGFSTFFPRPSYQDDAMSTFFQYPDGKYAGLYNPEGRGYPDIAAQALRFLFVVGGHLFSMNGTSCSAPTAAGIISLLNDFLLSNGKAPLGFLNPWLYGRGRAGLNDIVFGSNPGCNTEGFSAIPGWDPVTGLGTPDFGKLQQTLADAVT